MCRAKVENKIKTVEEKAISTSVCIAGQGHVANHTYSIYLVWDTIHCESKIEKQDLQADDS